ncbi:hypothetical protein G7Z17_g814 [Cylindrodendrum hubeiense]|uniref:Ankyrin repeat protein n=1 Tax=Cylindrodendrum hubeiense TaxID=595255 RepID=A0A9P5HM55_9HYPO|nr:hypothetical protein G7Z17_g814 [Cylindrodendrum hubeiense]
MSGLHLTAYFGIENAANQLISGNHACIQETAAVGRRYGGLPKHGHEAVVKLLLDKGTADIEVKSGNGETPLWRAAKNGQEIVVKLLLDNGADIETKYYLSGMRTHRTMNITVTTSPLIGRVHGCSSVPCTF